MIKTFLVFQLLFFTFLTLAQDTIKEFSLALPGGQVKDLAISYDGTHLVLLNLKDTKYQLYEYTRQNSNVWSEAKLIYQTDKKLQGPSYSPDNNRIFLSLSENEDFNIYYIERTIDGWTEAKFLDSVLFSRKDELSPWINPQANVLYFARDEGEKEKCFHFFYSVWKQGHWSKPVKIVPPINLGCENYLRMSIDGSKIFFVSYRPSTKSYDIFFTKKITDGIYTLPQRLDFSHIRTDEFSPSYDPLTHRLIFIRNEKSQNKIYFVNLNSSFLPDPVGILVGNITDKSAEKPLQAKVEVLNPITNSPITKVFTKTGKYKLVLPLNSHYTIKVTGDGLSTVYREWRAKDIKKTFIDTVNFRLFYNVNFYLNVYDQMIYDRLDVNIEIIETIKNKKINVSEIKKVSKGKYLVRLPIDGYYKIRITKDNYKDYSFNLDLRVPILYQNLEKDVDLEPLLQRVVIKVIDAFTQKGIETEVEVVSKTGFTYRTKVKTDKQGNVVLFLKRGDVYEVSVTPKGYTFFSQEFNLEEDNIKEDEIPEIVAKVKPLQEDMKMQFHNITFELNSADLKVEAYEILDKLVKFLKQNPNIKVEISAHTDDLGSDVYNKKLSLRRAKSVVEYLKEHGISLDRMIAIGYGEARPIVPNDSDEHRAMNRRVEFKILEIK